MLDRTIHLVVTRNPTSLHPHHRDVCELDLVGGLVYHAHGDDFF